MITEREWELRMYDNGVTRYQERDAALAKRGREDESPAGRHMIRESLKPFAEAILAYSTEQQRLRNKRKRSKASVCFAEEFLTMMSTDKPKTARQGAEILALIVATVVQRYLAPTRDPKKERRGLATAVQRIAEAIEFQEHRARQEAAGATEESFTKWTSTWDLSVRGLVGEQFLRLYEQSCREVERQNVKTEDWKDLKILVRSELVVEIHEAHKEFKKQYDSTHEFLVPQWLPTIEPPLPWNEEGTKGGYHFIPRSLVKRSHHRHGTNPGLRMVEAVNRVQATPWRINTQVVKVMKELMKRHVAVGKIPVPVPGRPRSSLKRTLTNAEKYLVYRERDVRSVQQAMYLKAQTTCKAAEHCLEEVGEGPIWFPHQIDWRGRFYPLPEHLNPQGPDYARALLMFAEGQTIDTKEAGDWLAVHGANCYGIDKVSVEDRMKWIRDHAREIQVAATDPLGSTFWREPGVGDPWQFLAFCFEWADFLREGFGFISRLPVAIDATCNGLQHYAVMLGDKALGKLVNMPPSETPQDLYRHIAEKVRERVRVGDYAKWFEKHELAKRTEILKNKRKTAAWLDKAASTAAQDTQKLRELDITRKMLKSPVMTYGYGAKDQSRRGELRDFLTDDGFGTKASLWLDVPNPVVVYLNQIITDEIEQTIPTVVGAMDKIRKLAQHLAIEDKPVNWPTPSGGEIRQHYVKFKKSRVKTLGGRLTYQVATDRMDKNKQARALPPNFIHSLDACHLAETVLLAATQGVVSFAMIHDSYGTTAVQTAILEDARQHAMGDLYKLQYPLEWLLSRAIDDSSNEDYSGYEESTNAPSPFVEEDGEDD